MTLRRLPALAGLAVLAGTCAELAGHRAFTRLVRRDVQALYAGACPARAGVVTEQMLVDLPEPVRRYLRYAGVVGKPFPRTVWLRQEGRMRPGPGQPWMPLAAEEHYAVQPPGFVWAGTLRCGGSRARAGRLALARRVLGAQCCGMERVQWLRGQLADARGGQVVFLSHCLLNQNVRYLGGAGRAGGVSEAVAGYLGRGIGICQLPCPEQHAWGGVLKRRMLLAYGSAGTLRAPAARLLLRPFLWYTRRVYARLARAVTRDILDYRRCGVAVTGVVGIGGSPSCGVATTLDLPAAVGALTRCPAARLDRQTLNEDIVAAHVHPGEGLFIRALRRQLARAGAGVPMDEHDLLAELGLRRRQGQAR